MSSVFKLIVDGSIDRKVANAHLKSRSNSGKAGKDSFKKTALKSKTMYATLMYKQHGGLVACPETQREISLPYICAQDKVTASCVLET